MISFHFGKLGNDWEQFLQNGGNVPRYDTIVVLVLDENGSPVTGAKVELIQQTVLFFTYTDDEGKAIVQGETGESYTLIISGDKIETKTLNNWLFNDSTIQVEIKKYLEVNPEYIWLTRGNNYTDTVDVMSNVDWFIQ